jgi:LytS/YehU family sensor histidine kinase
LIGFNAGIKSFVHWSEEKIRQAEKDRLYFYNELAFLKHQISPHFFMNTLNNIHALVDINAEKAKNAIIKLSNLMRYLLYESDIQKVLLKKEIDFIESYIELMRLRYNEDKLTIETEYPENIENVYVPSSLFLSFIENAFKYGVNPQVRSLIKIKFTVENGWLKFNIVNSLWNFPGQQFETTGIGLENVRKRLDLIYKEKYTLDISPNVNTYNVNLIIPVL